MEVRSFGHDKESRDHLSQYFFRAKTCVKMRKNGSFRGGKPPGRNARGNPWGPVRTRGGPHPILRLFSKRHGIRRGEALGLVPGIQMLTFNFWKLEVGGWSPSSERWTLHIGCQFPEFNLPEAGSWNPISRRRLLESNLWEIELGFKLPEVGS